MPKNSNKKWTPEDEKLLLELKAAGEPQAVIVVALGRSIGSIVGRLGVLITRSGLRRAASPVTFSWLTQRQCPQGGSII
jgi:hypothetical protein